MKLRTVIEVLRSEEPARGTWWVAVLDRRGPGPPQEGERFTAYPIYDLWIEQGDQEISLLIDEHSTAPPPWAATLTLRDLLSRLETFMPMFADYGVFSGAVEKLPDGGQMRIDMPLVGTALIHERKVFGFLMWPLEKWKGSG